jgi:hypothetical protein
VARDGFKQSGDGSFDGTRRCVRDILQDETGFEIDRMLSRWKITVSRPDASSGEYRGSRAEPTTSEINPQL